MHAVFCAVIQKKIKKLLLASLLLIYSKVFWLYSGNLTQVKRININNPAIKHKEIT